MTWYKLLPQLFCILAVVGVGYADSIEVDVSGTPALGIYRYCFRVINDDEPDPDHHIMAIASVRIKYLPDGAVPLDDRFRNNIFGPEGWQGDTSGGGWDPINLMPIVRKITWWTEESEHIIKPGSRLGCFCFVSKGKIAVTELSTGFFSLEDGLMEHSTSPLPFGANLIDDSNDTDFLPDKDGDGIPDKFDPDP